MSLPSWLPEGISDIWAKSPSSGSNLAGLDGFRGMAVLVVLMDHCGAFGNTNRGGYGVIAFFVLSGFLLTLPFARDDAPSISAGLITRFLIRRVKRIWPLAAFSLFLDFYLLQGIASPVLRLSPKDTLQAFVRNALFLESFGHYWSVAQELYFYLLLPLVLIVAAYLMRRSRLASSAFCFALAAILAKTEGVLPIYLHWNGRRQDLMADLFLIGVGSAFLLPYLTAQHLVAKAWYRHLWALLGFASVTYFLVGNQPVLDWISSILPLAEPVRDRLLALSDFAVGLLAAALIVAIVTNANGWIGRGFGLVPIRALGVVGYSMYLVHPFLLEAGRIHQFGTTISGELRFMVVVVIAYLVSLATYALIEKPFYQTNYRASLKGLIFRLAPRQENL